MQCGGTAPQWARLPPLSVERAFAGCCARPLPGRDGGTLLVSVGGQDSDWGVHAGAECVRVGSGLSSEGWLAAPALRLPQGRKCVDIVAAVLAIPGTSDRPA